MLKRIIIWVLLKNQSNLVGAIEAYEKAVSIKPNYAEAYNNMGVALKNQSNLVGAIEAYEKAVSIKPDYAEAYYNMGNALKDEDKLPDAIEAFNNAISIKPDYAEAYHNLSSIKKYTEEDQHFLQIKKLYKREDLGDYDRCQLSFALAKIYEDFGKLDHAFNNLSAGNSLRKKLLNYSIDQDQNLLLN